MNAPVLCALTLVCYLAAGAAIFAGTAAAPIPQSGGWRSKSGYPISRLLLAVGIVLHFCAIGAWCVTIHRSPFASPFGTWCTLAWAIALSIVAVDPHGRLVAIDAGLITAASVVLLVSLTQARDPLIGAPILDARLVTLHVMAILLSFALFAVAFVCAGLYLAEARMLKTRPPAAILQRVPPLETLDSVAFQAVAFALPLLTAGLALGIAREYAGGLHGGQVGWWRDAHTIASIGVWLVYGAYIGARVLVGWRGRRLQYVLIAGMAVAVLLYLLPTHTHRFI
ncbi:MAG: cytochrome c biogenesis protein CcsA [Armatimonadetes bacterium]|nr:cytochrome c biogenesis protein CcsA [Armatimonadota bacterium]MDE2205574.1 cytochrome c biogenesis protein CcsA [Armatimonadota bacterium]